MFWNSRKKEDELKRPHPIEIFDQPAENEVMMKKQTTNTFQSQLPSLGTNNLEENFALQLQTPADETTNSVWNYTIPTLGSNERKLLFQFCGGSSIVINIPTSTFPQELYLTAGGFSGYSDKSGSPTSTVAIFRIRELIPLTGAGGVVSYTIIYSIMDPMTWDIGTQRTIQLFVGDANGVYTPPLNLQVNVEFNILHVSY